MSVWLCVRYTYHCVCALSSHIQLERQNKVYRYILYVTLEFEFEFCAPTADFMCFDKREK